MQRMQRTKKRTTPIMNLPILTKTNRRTYPNWHSYYERVYKTRVTHTVDLNQFNWFYWFSPLGNLPVHTITSWSDFMSDINLPGLDVPFVFTYNPSSSPETQFRKAGFFVRRIGQHTNTPIEVHRTNTSVFIEKGACWFFLTIGSGFFLKPTAYICKRRDEFDEWNEYDPFLSTKGTDIDTIVIQSNYFGRVGLSEIVYRLQNKDALANTSVLPLFRGNRSYKHTYSHSTKCMV